MPFDASIRPIPVDVRTRTTASTPLLPGDVVLATGDVVLAPPTLAHDALVAADDGLTVHTLVAPKSVSVMGDDLEALLVLAETDRLTPAALTDNNFQVGAITADKLSAPLPVRLGGTGADTSVGLDGMLAVGAGTGAAAMSFGTGLAWDAASATLRVESEVRLDEFSIAAVEGSLVLSGPGVAVDLLDYRLGLPPVVTLSEPDPGSSDTSATLDYAVTDGNGDARYLHLAWYAADGDRPRLPVEVALGDGALSTATLDLTVVAASGQFTVPDLAPITNYVVRATAEDRRGNLSAVHPLAVRTTELGAPVVDSIHTYVTAATSVGFTSRNGPDASEMTLVAGVLTAATPAITEADIDVHIAKFYSQTIAANAVVDIAMTFSQAHDPGNAFAEENIAEARTYYPFVFYRDAEGNSVLQYGATITNPDVTAPDFDEGPAFVSATTNAITISKTITDAVGVTEAKAYVSMLDGNGAPLAVPTEAQVFQFGDAVSATGDSDLLNYHSDNNVARPLEHTARYRVYVAARDAAGNSVSGAAVDAYTLDDTPPSVDTLAVARAGMGDTAVEWTASDAGPHGSVTNVYVRVASSEDLVPTAEDVRTSPTLTSTSAASSSTFMDPVAAYLDTRVYAVAEDDAASFGNVANLLSTVATAVLPVPVVNSQLTFAQLSDGVDVGLAAGDLDVATSAGSLQMVRLVLFNASEPTLVGAESNAVFSDTEPSAALSDVLFGAAANAEATNIAAQP